MRYEAYTKKRPWRFQREALWIGSFLVLVAGTAWFAIWPSTLSYWLGTSLYLPFGLMVVERGKRKRFTDGDPDPTLTDNGPWSGP